jgi:hypothetical protein
MAESLEPQALLSTHRCGSPYCKGLAAWQGHTLQQATETRALRSSWRQRCSNPASFHLHRAAAAAASSCCYCCSFQQLRLMVRYSILRGRSYSCSTATSPAGRCWQQCCGPGKHQRTTLQRPSQLLDLLLQLRPPAAAAAAAGTRCQPQQVQQQGQLRKLPLQCSTAGYC